MTLAERIRAHRAKEPYPSLRDMAEELGISAAYLSDIERGLVVPKGSVLAAFANYFGMSFEKLRAEVQRPRVVQISATEVKGELRVALLYSDGSIGVSYPEREEVAV